MATRIVSVLKTPRSSYNPDRPISGLLESQVTMLEEALLTYEPDYSRRRRKPKTEKEAAQYIGRLHECLNEHMKDAADAAKAHAGADGAKTAGVAATFARGSSPPRSVATREGAKRFAATQGQSVSVRRLTEGGAPKAEPAPSRTTAGRAAKPKARKRVVRASAQTKTRAGSKKGPRR